MQGWPIAMYKARTLHVCTSGLLEADALGEICVGVLGHLSTIDTDL